MVVAPQCSHVIGIAPQSAAEGRRSDGAIEYVTTAVV
jgi:hypothetical protein